MPRLCGSISAGFLTDARENYHHSLKALAIREKKIHTVGSPKPKIESTPVYLHVEVPKSVSDVLFDSPVLNAFDFLKRSIRPFPDNERTLCIVVLVEQVYETGRYDDLGYGAELDPPLAGEDAAWAEALLKAAGRR